jgi:hypothetical protein
MGVNIHDHAAAGLEQRQQAEEHCRNCQETPAPSVLLGEDEPKLSVTVNPDQAPGAAASCLRTISVIHTGANGEVQPGGVG